MKTFDNVASLVIDSRTKTNGDAGEDDDGNAKAEWYKRVAENYELEPSVQSSLLSLIRSISSCASFFFVIFIVFVIGQPWLRVVCEVAVKVFSVNLFTMEVLSGICTCSGEAYPS